MKSLHVLLLIAQVSLAFQARVAPRGPGKWMREVARQAPTKFFADSNTDQGAPSTSTQPDITAVPTAASSLPSPAKARVQRLTRSSALILACTLTKLLARHVSIVQASSIVGLLGCATRSPAMAAAIFCGSFAGMSGQVTSLLGATGLGSLAAAVYYLWDANKIGVGKGGRLGTIAFLGSLLWHGLVQSPAKGFPVAQQTLEILGWKAAGGLAAFGSALHFARQSQAKRSLLKNFLTGGVLASIACSGWGVIPAKELLLTSLSVYVSSLVVKESDGVVLPVAAIGLLGSFTPHAAPIYLGAFIGMTGLSAFGTLDFAKASIFSATLLKLGLWNGFGGKLGMQAFLGVLFGMQ